MHGICHTLQTSYSAQYRHATQQDKLQVVCCGFAPNRFSQGAEHKYATQQDRLLAGGAGIDTRHMQLGSDTLET